MHYIALAVIGGSSFLIQNQDKWGARRDTEVKSMAEALITKASGKQGTVPTTTPCSEPFHLSILTGGIYSQGQVYGKWW